MPPEQSTQLRTAKEALHKANNLPCYCLGEGYTVTVPVIWDLKNSVFRCGRCLGLLDCEPKR